MTSPNPLFGNSLPDHKSEAKPKPYKAVLIVGDRQPIPKAIKGLYRQEGYLLISDGNSKTLIEKPVGESKEPCLEDLRGRIDSTTRIDIWAHGLVKDGEHYIDIDNTLLPTRNLLKSLGDMSGMQSLHTHLHSCYGGAAAKDVRVLPVDSVLITHADESHPTSVYLNEKTIRQSAQDLSETDAVKDFNRRFLLNVKHTATISISKNGGAPFQHTVRPPRQLLANDKNIVRHFKAERKKFVKAYHDAFSKADGLAAAVEELFTQPAKKEADGLPRLEPKDVSEWKKDCFLYLTLIGDKQVVTALSSKNAKGFKDCIEPYEDGMTALSIARDSRVAKAILDAISRKELSLPPLLPLLNVRDGDGDTALMRGIFNTHQSVEIINIIFKELDEKEQFSTLTEQNRRGYNILHGALLLFKKGIKDPNDNSLEAVSIILDRISLLKELDDRTDILKAPDMNGDTPMMHVMNLWNLKLISLLFKTFEKAEERLFLLKEQGEKDGRNIVHTAVWRASKDPNDENLKILKEILGYVPQPGKPQDIADIFNTPDQNGKSALMYALDSPQVMKVISATLRKDIAVIFNTPDRFGKTPLMYPKVRETIVNALKNPELKEIILTALDEKQIEVAEKLAQEGAIQKQNGNNLKRNEKEILNQKTNTKFNFQESIRNSNPAKQEILEDIAQTAKQQTEKDMQTATQPIQTIKFFGDRKLSTATKSTSIRLIAENDHQQEHSTNIDKLISLIEDEKIPQNSVIALERKQEGHNLGMQDVIILANILKHNELNEGSPIIIPEELQESAIYKDAQLYNAATAKGILVIGVEGKDLAYPKESTLYNETREEHMSEQLSQLVENGLNVIFPVGERHVGPIEDQLQQKGVSAKTGKLKDAQDVDTSNAHVPLKRAC